MDGVPQWSMTAWLTEPYTNRDDGWCGEAVIDMDMVRDYVKKANDMGIGVRAHCTGDRACIEMIDAYSQSSNTKVINCLEHGMAVTDPFLDKVREYTKTKILGVNAQPGIIGADRASRLTEIFLGTERTERSWGFQSLKKAGATVCFSSDCPNAFADIYDIFCYAANRLSDGTGPYAGVGLGMDEAYSAAEILMALTAEPAKTIGRDNFIGKLKPGFKADIAIFDQDIFAMDRMEYGNIRIYKTILNGEEVYKKA